MRIEPEKTKRSQPGIALSPALVVFVLLLVLVQLVCGEASYARTSRSATAILNEIRSKKRALESKLKKLKEKKASVSSEVEALDKQADKLTLEVSRVAKELSQKESELNDIKQRIEEITQEITARKQSIKERVLATYMQGELTYLDVIFDAENFRDFVNRIFYLNLIFENDQRNMLELRKKKEEKKYIMEKLTEKVQEIEATRAALNEKKRQVSEARRQKAMLLLQISKDAELAEQQIRELEEESRRIEADIRRLQGRYKGPAWRGRFLKPVDGSIRSGYGMRYHPISREWAMHTGVDIAAPYGSPVRAGGDGMVIFTGWRGGYGLTVIIDHGGKLSTLYAHLSGIAVSEGTILKAGQTIGYVGSTGYSTGPHLHFEVRVNGSPVNPLGNL